MIQMPRDDEPKRSLPMPHPALQHEPKVLEIRNLATMPVTDQEYQRLVNQLRCPCSVGVMGVCDPTKPYRDCTDDELMGQARFVMSLWIRAKVSIDEGRVALSEQSREALAMDALRPPSAH